jgi:FAD-linked oxidoreductase
MPISRRRFLGTAAAGGLATLAAGCGPRATQPQMPVSYELGKPLPWVNWAGNQFCRPARRLGPASEDAVCDALRRATGVVRAVGAGHSFTALVPTDDTLIATDLMTGLADHDPVSCQAEVFAGTRLHDLGPLLAGVDQALPNMPDIDYIALGGAIATSAHATGPRFGSLSSTVTGLTLATPAGDLVECSALRNPQLFAAARTSLGALGIVTRIRLQNQPSFDLTEVNRVERTADVLEDLEDRLARHRHFELMPILHSDFAVTIATDPAKDGDRDAGQDNPRALNTLRTVFDAVGWIPGSDQIFSWLVDRVAGDQATVRTGPSYLVFPHIREIRFREMEYAVPADAGTACLREILDTVRRRRIPVCFPLEVRRVAADDVWLSMFEGRSATSISVHQFGDLDYQAYFAEIEPIFWKYEGRPHWGKLHTLDAGRLAARYQRHWRDFQEVRAAVDPQGKMLNPYLKTVLGV